MTAASNTNSTRVRVGEHRARLRAQGLRPMQIWVPDVRAASFRAEAHRQSLTIAASVEASADQAFIDAITGLDFDDRDDR